MDHQRKKSSEYIWQPEKGLILGLFCFNNDIHKKRLGSKAKMELEFLRIFRECSFKRYLFKGVIGWIGCISGYLPKWNRDLGLAYGEHEQHISYENIFYNTLLTLNVPCIFESCIKTKKLNFYGHSLKRPLKEPQTINIYWFYLLHNHVDTSTKSK